MEAILHFVRHRAALVVLVVLSVYHSAVLLRTARVDYLRDPDPDAVSVFEHRFDSVRARLSDSTTVGYITDAPIDGDWLIDYYLTQYTLSPVVVSDSLAARFVIANLRDPKSLAGLLQKQDLFLLSDYGNGIFLLSHQPR